MTTAAISADGVMDYRRLARHTHGVSFLDRAGPTSELAYPVLGEQARVAAGGYLDQGLKPGDRLVITVPTSADYLIAVTGALLAGLVPCTVAPPTTPSDPDSAGMRHLRAAISTVRPAAIITTDPITAAAIGASGQPPVLAVDALRHHAAAPWARLPEPQPHDLHHIQLTSGSTSAPRAAALTHAAVAANVDVLSTTCELDADLDTISSWLPLYHDMGFVQVLAGLTAGVRLDLMRPFTFLRDPLAWLRHISTRGGTITAAPPFAYRAVADRQEARSEELDLSRLRRAYVGAEPIPVDALRRFMTAFTPSGLADDTLVPCYGMAETVLATTLALGPQITTDDSFGRVRAVHLDRDALHQDQRATPTDDLRRALTVVSCGPAVAGLDIAIGNAEDVACPEGWIGEIRVRGSSLMAGYLDPDGRVAPLPGGWHSTGDLGFCQAGDLFVVGRAKEMLIVRGRNLPPYDVEAAIEPHPAIGDGRTAVFSYLSDDGAEQTVAVVETRARASDLQQLRADITTAVRQAFTFNLTDVVFLSRGGIPRTTSGKRQRDLLRRRYMANELT